MQPMGDVELVPGSCGPWDEGAFIAALIGGGDSRLMVDPSAGTNKYLVAPRPDEAGVCFSSCTASPISPVGFRSAKRCYVDLISAPSAAEAETRYRNWESDAKLCLGSYLGTIGVGDIVLLPSGTDGVLFCSILLSLEARGRTMTPILPAAAETGSGVPRAALRQAFDGPSGCGGLADAVEIMLRRPDGSLRDDGEVSEDYARAARTSANRPVIYLTHGTKTGLVAPLLVPLGAEVVVDACQLRLSPTVVQDYLRRGWPVVVTGSKFIGGPPFSGAVLLPRGRFEGVREAALVAWRRIAGTSPVGLAAVFGPLLRWVAAATEIGCGSSEPVAEFCPPPRQASYVRRVLERIPGVTLVPGPSSSMIEASGVAESIFSFAIRDPAEPERYLPVAQLRSVYQALAQRGVLIGQPVEMGSFGVLRIAFSLRDQLTEDWAPRLDRATDELSGLVAKMGSRPKAMSDRLVPRAVPPAEQAHAPGEEQPG